MTLEEWKTKLSPFEFNEVYDAAKTSWEDFVEDYVEEHKKRPPQTMRKKHIEKYFKEHAISPDRSVRQSQKEDEQMDILINAFVKNKKRLSAKDIGLLLEKNGVKRGASVKTIYRRILPDLKEQGIVKGDDNLYYYNPDYDETGRPRRIRIYKFLREILEDHKDAPLYKDAKSFLDWRL